MVLSRPNREGEFSFSRWAAYAPFAGHDAPGGAPAADDCFHRSFSKNEQTALLDEDTKAQTAICVILGSLIAAGMLLGIGSVLLISWLNS